MPEANLMVVLGAEHFGVAQLHQLRGRVGRGGQKAGCVLVREPQLRVSLRRLPGRKFVFSNAPVHYSKAVLKALGISDAKQIGRLVGDVLKSHKGRVEAGDVKRIAEELLRS